MSSSPKKKKIWTIFILAAEAEEFDENYIMNDLGRLGFDQKINNKIAFHFLIDQGLNNHRIRWTGNNFKKVSYTYSSKYSSRPTCTELEITNFIKEGKELDPAEHYAFFYSGGGFGFYTTNQETCYIPVSTWKNYLSVLGEKWDLVAFDGCLMAMLETVYELRSVTKFILACEQYEPWQGFCSKEMVKAFESSENVIEIASQIIKSFISRNNLDPRADPADITLLKTSKVEALMKELKERKISSSSSVRIDPLDSDQASYLDLYSAVVKPDKKFDKVFNQVVLDYQQTEKLKKLLAASFYHGMSLCPTNKLDPNARRSYLSLEAPQVLEWLGRLKD
jgi:hypothetical protein